MAEDRKKGPSWVSRVGNVLTSKPVVVGAAALAGAAAVGAGAEYIFGDSIADQHSGLKDLLNGTYDGVFSNPDHAVAFKPEAIIALDPASASSVSTNIIANGDHAVSIASTVSPDTSQLTFSNEAAGQLSSVLDSKAVADAAKANQDFAKVVADFKTDLTDHTVSKDTYTALMDKLGGVQGYNIQQFTVDNPPPGYFGYTAPNSPEMGEYAGKQYLFHNDLAKAFEDKNQGVVDFLNYASSPVHTSGVIGGAIGALAGGSAAAGIKETSNQRAMQELREDPNFWRAQIAEEMAARDQGVPGRSA